MKFINILCVIDCEEMWDL